MVRLFNTVEMVNDLKRRDDESTSSTASLAYNPINTGEEQNIVGLEREHPQSPLTHSEYSRMARFASLASWVVNWLLFFAKVIH